MPCLCRTEMIKATYKFFFIFGEVIEEQFLLAFVHGFKYRFIVLPNCYPSLEIQSACWLAHNFYVISILPNRSESWCAIFSQMKNSLEGMYVLQKHAEDAVDGTFKQRRRLKENGKNMALLIRNRNIRNFCDA